MRSFKALLFVFLLLHLQAQAQEGSVWSLQRCIQYAISHNISIKQDSLNARLARYTVLQSQLSQIPAVSASGSYGKSFGRSINPTTNQFVEGSYNSLSASGTVSAMLFSGLQVRNNIAKNKYSLEAAMADLDQLKDDVSLNVANAFLVALLAKEQINISKNQVDVSIAQLAQTKAFADAGRLPELNVAQLESQLATDSSNLINSIASYNSAILDLKALLNLDFGEPFTIQVPDAEVGEQLMMSSLQPGDVYEKARGHFGSVKGSKLRVSAAEKGLAAARGGIYPQLSVGYQLGTNYASNYQSYAYTATPNGLQLAGIAVDSVNNHFYNVYQPAFTTTTTATTIPFNNQFDNNLRHSVFLNLNIPIFNGWQTQYSIKQAKVNLESQRLNEYNAELTLKQNVYKAHNSAVNSIQKYNAARRANDAASRALEFARKRYDLGLTSTVDLLVTQSTQFNAASNMVIAKYDLIFKLKVIDYYLGKEIKL
ncbi:TolC family protein [Flavipsychrobacter stenotrophus]|uniref:TolC family protein n=1 Tax=Flavipsychrobacter stenotrophus TaxID=2077091 RepID=A0A2S7SWJ6_9BACT|nr:TolC family protein [Flavipsychrobacter stenotrophus]PQJ11088.1 TolC family protein [Flavipsychrobacter stenotrophus]